MAKRFITRVELTTPTRTRLNQVTAAAGMTQVAVLSRLVNWFAGQTDPVQAIVLGRIPPEMEADAAKMILEKLATPANVPGESAAK
jgi:hypothetical protein